MVHRFAIAYASYLAFEEGSPFYLNNFCIVLLYWLLYFHSRYL